jgi:hypothetical protein
MKWRLVNEAAEVTHVGQVVVDHDGTPEAVS